jgi:GTP-binding protein LepA
MDLIRNFCIIAHIDHGKSTLADRLIEYTNTEIYKKEKIIDCLERERGFTIKSHTIQMNYKFLNKQYTLNLIDTPGHVDFSHEVSRSISACEGALLLVDATQGIQAQTLSNFYIAIKNNLTVIPIVNKIDLPNCNIKKVIEDLVNLTGCNRNDIILTSAKLGIGIDKIIELIITKISPPNGKKNSPLQALIFDSVYNKYKGVELYIKVINGEIKIGQKIKMMSTGNIYYAEEIGIMKLRKFSTKFIETGNVGYVIAGVKNTFTVKVGDTITSVNNPANTSIKGFEKVKPIVFAGIYPVDTREYQNLKKSIEKLQLNDSSLIFDLESSKSLGFGFRCGFLGLLHMEIIKERLEREYNMNIIMTVPNVSYKIYHNQDDYCMIKNPYEISNLNHFVKIEEPYIQAIIITLDDTIGAIIELCLQRRGILKKQLYLTNNRVELIFEIPFSEVIFDFYSNLKTLSKGYASFDYIILDYRESDLVKIDILINKNVVDALSFLVYRKNAFIIGKKICKKLSDLIPKHQFEITIQAAIGNKIIARETIQSIRKNVISKCYGGDITRKNKLLEKQKIGKKKMKAFGQVEIPTSIFIEVIKI